MRGCFYERISAELPVPGLFLVHGTQPVGEVTDILELILLASEETNGKAKSAICRFDLTAEHVSKQRAAST